MNWDAELERRVWQRVRGREDVDGTLEELIRLCREQAYDLRRLDGVLHRQERETLGLLTGLNRVCFGRESPIAAAPGPARDRASLLRRCCRRAERMLGLYIAMESHGRYGPLFTDLTRRQRAVCARLDAMGGKK